MVLEITSDSITLILASLQLHHFTDKNIPHIIEILCSNETINATLTP